MESFSFGRTASFGKQGLVLFHWGDLHLIENQKNKPYFLQKKWRVTVGVLGAAFSIFFYAVGQKTYISMLLCALTLCWLSFWIGNAFYASKKEGTSEYASFKTDIQQLILPSDFPFAYAVVNQQKKVLFATHCLKHYLKKKFIKIQ